MGHKILVVDDEPLNLNLLEQELGRGKRCQEPFPLPLYVSATFLSFRL